MSQYEDAYINQTTPKQHLKLNSWKNWATLRLNWKIALFMKKSLCFTKLFTNVKVSFFFYLCECHKTEENGEK